jgi:hypothetical protein
MIVKLLLVVVVGMVVTTPAMTTPVHGIVAEQFAGLSPTPVLYWSRAVVRALTAHGPGASNFSADAAIYAGIVHLAMYNAAAAAALTADPEASPEVAVATAAHHVLVGLQPGLGLTPAVQSNLDDDYADYLIAIPDGPAKSAGFAVGEHVAAAVLKLRANDGRDLSPQLGERPLVAPPPGPGVWQPDSSPAVGLRVSGLRPLALQHPWQFRPAGPPALTSQTYLDDAQELRDVGGQVSTLRTPGQTQAALFWADDDVRQWNHAMLRLVREQELDLVGAARMLTLAHVSGADATIACFDAKFTYWFWRPSQALQNDPTWHPLATRLNVPEYPSERACYAAAIAQALRAFLGTDDVRVSLYSRVTHTTRGYDHLQDVVETANQAQVSAGLNFRTSVVVGSHVGQDVAAYIADNLFQPVE